MFGLGGDDDDAHAVAYLVLPNSCMFDAPQHATHAQRAGGIRGAPLSSWLHPWHDLHLESYLEKHLQFGQEPTRASLDM